MKRLLPTIAIIVFLLLGVTTMGVSVVEGGDTPFDSPLVYDWLNNDTDDDGSHVSNYSVESPQRYFSGGLSGPRNIEDELNESAENNRTAEAIYRVYDETFQKYPTEDVYNRWNSNNPYDYGQREWIAEFKKDDAKNASGGDFLELNDDEYLLRDAWTGIYSIQPSSYAHYKPPTSNDDSDYYGVSRQLVGDTVTVYAIVNANRDVIPDDKTVGSGEGATRHQYSFDGLSQSAILYIEDSSECSGRCQIAQAPVSQNVALFSNVNIEEYVSPGDSFNLVVQSTSTIDIEDNVDNRVEVRERVTCGENETSPCYDYDLEWHDDETNTVSESITTTDRQTVTYPSGLNQDEETVNEKVTYERAIYPNGTTELYINTEEMDGMMTEDPIWRRIEVGNHYLQSQWRVWSSQNTSWKFMYPNSNSDESDDRHRSHVLPLAFHTAPTEYGIETSNQVTWRQTPQTIDPLLLIFGAGYSEPYYDSPKLLRDETCKSKYPEHNNNPEDVYCGWWLSGVGNDVEPQEETPYLSIETDGSWKTYRQLYITAPNTEQASETITMYGLTPQESVEIEADRTINIQETKLYLEKIDDNLGKTGSNNTWVEVRVTLVNEETGERISTQGENDNYIEMENANVESDGVYSPKIVNTNESGQVQLKVYDVKDEGIKGKFKSEHWSEVEEDEEAYSPTKLDSGMAVPAFPMANFMKILIGFGGALYIIVAITVYFMNILQMETTIQKEWGKIVPNEFYKIILWSLILYFILSII